MEIGKIYNVTHSRKGNFTVKLLDQDDTWSTVLMVAGHTTTMLRENQAFEGDEETLRTSFFTKCEEVLPSFNYIEENK